MRFGGHETFFVRETWLSKGLRLAEDNPNAFADPFVADELGVGSNMAKSIRYWMLLTGLAESKGGKSFVPTALGKLVLERDEAMLRPATWWALHVNVVSQSTEAIAWHWIFSLFSGGHRFDRRQCIDGLTRHLKSGGQRMPSDRTISVDIGVLLSTYARPVPPAVEDPEETIDSPFRQLGLMVNYRQSDTYRIDRGPKPIPPEILCYALAKTCLDDRASGGGLDISVREAIARPGGPGRILALSSDAFATALFKAQQALGPKDIDSEMQGGDRVIKLAAKSPETWLAEHYKRIS